jgi:hypothetical protein
MTTLGPSLLNLGPRGEDTESPNNSWLHHVLRAGRKQRLASGWPEGEGGEVGGRGHDSCNLYDTLVRWVLPAPLLERGENRLK